MARLSVAVAVTFFLLTLCHARIPLDPSEKDAVLPDPAPKTYIPSNEQPESEAATLVEWKAESTVSEAESEPLTMISFKAETPEWESKSEPLITTSFRPVNRHFRPFPLTSRRGHRCRHHRRENHIQMFKPWGPRFPDREVPYGNDMIMSPKEDSRPDPEFRGGAREMWARLSHAGHRFHREDDNEERSEHMKKRHHHHHQHVERDESEREDDHHHEHDHHHEIHEHEHGHESGFMKSVSKFLDLF